MIEKEIKHFELTISYDDRNIKVIVQKLISEQHIKLYAVWPKDEQLEKSHGNVNIYFIQEAEKNKTNQLTITHKVKYDFKSTGNTFRDTKFEFAVWEQLSQTEDI